MDLVEKVKSLNPDTYEMVLFEQVITVPYGRMREEVVKFEFTNPVKTSKFEFEMTPHGNDQLLWVGHTVFHTKFV